jgi:thiosulfate/3-mercaptopyruvate sulfurtransferase
VGATAGSILFNELFPLLKGLYRWGLSEAQGFGQEGVAMVYQSLGLTRPVFALLFTAVAVLSFWVSEAIERRAVAQPQGSPRPKQVGRPFLAAFSVSLVAVAASLFIFSAQPTVTASQGYASPSRSWQKQILASVANAEDHIEPEELAERLLNQEPGLVVVDVRPREEFEAFHIRGAVNVALPDLPLALEPHKNQGLVVLYSNGMTHPAQARDILQLMGYNNVYILTDGLTGFMERCLKPVSLRSAPVSDTQAHQIDRWRAYFHGQPVPVFPKKGPAIAHPAGIPGMISTQWVSDNLANPAVKIVDCRSQPQYNTGHIPGALAISPESFRGVVQGVPSVLLPAHIIAATLSLMGIQPDHMVVLVYGNNRVRDATLVAMALLRVGHPYVAILDGGFHRWAAEKRPVSTELPHVGYFNYQAARQVDDFTVDYRTVLQYVKNKRALILDTRPASYFSGEKSDEARPGHIPGAVNRPLTEDLTDDSLKSLETLEAAYAHIIPDKKTTVVVHCRTGHQASQTYFVLKYLLEYENVLWYDAGWTEWAARKELPVVTGNGQTP